MATIVFNDTFTEAIDLELSLHIPDTGLLWTKVEDTLGTLQFDVKATSDRIQCNTNSTSNRVVYEASPSPALSVADYEVECEIVGLTGTTSSSDDDLLFLCGRRIDGNNFYAVGVYRGTVNLLKLWKKVAGTVVELGSIAYSPALNDVLKLIMSSTTISVEVNDVEQLSVADSGLGAVGAAAIGLGNALITTDDTSNSWRVDNFKVTENPAQGPGGGGTIPVIVYHLRQQGIVG